MTKQLIQIAHSPDSDDAFMFYALAKDKITSDKYEFRHTLSDIQTLNQKALEGVYEVSAISFHAYPQVADRYALLSCGTSMGDGYGPMVISHRPESTDAIAKKKIAIPGRLTTAYLALQLFEPKLNVVEMPFDQILPAVEQGEVELGLIIHEGQLTYQDHGVHKILDLGEWWKDKTGGLPLPLGGNVIRRDLGEASCREIDQILQAGIQYSLDHRQEALDYALSFARGMDPNLADRFVAMYVNELTVDYGERGRKALHEFFDQVVAKGLLKEKPPLEFVGD